MKYAALILSLVALARAQSCESAAAAVPKCAVSCLSEAASAQGCSPGDYKCQCEPAHSAAIQAAAQTCILTSCGAQAMEVPDKVLAVCACASSAVEEPAVSEPADTTTYPSQDTYVVTGTPAITEAPTVSELTPSYPISGAPQSSAASTGWGGNSTTSVYPPIAKGGATRAYGCVGAGVALIVGFLAAL